MSKQGSLSDTVYDRVLAHIVDGEYPIGSRLPSEQKLCAIYNASRPIIREALAHLRAQDIIESRKGAGSYVRRSAPQTSAMTDDVSSMAELDACYDFRIALEGECAFLAALNRREKDIELLEASCSKFSSELNRNNRGGISDDVQFHLLIAHATHNPFFINAFQTITSRVHMAIDISRKLTATSLGIRRRTLVTEHRAVLDSIAKGDGAKARKAMRTHVTNSKNRVFKGESH